MKSGYLSEYFEGVAAKRLSAVDITPSRSNQHEINATKPMRDFLGAPEVSINFPTRFIYLTDEDTFPIMADAYLNYGNRRKDKPRAPEFRFYYPNTTVSESAKEGDLLVIAKKRDGNLLVIIAKKGSSVENQIEWLFGFGDLSKPGFSVKVDLETERDRIEYASRLILENIGIAVGTSGEFYLDEMISLFKGEFPTTKEFSQYARSTLKEISPKESPDKVLMAWMDREDILFRTLERHIVAEQLSSAFKDPLKPFEFPNKGTDKSNFFVANAFKNEIDVDGFVSYALSVLNRRKSRVGRALENHLSELFKNHGLRFSQQAETENKTKPDFIFPGALEYRNPSFDAQKLIVLGVKTTCKDRWRQVLSEADRVEDKHLLTLEPAISKGQTDEMAAKRLQLIVPRRLHSSYTDSQQAWLMDVEAFIQLALQRQKR